jgi:DNA-binding NtrC family response regulator
LQATPKRKLDILIIDDDRNILNILSKILQRKGHTITTTETGQEAITKIQTQRYDVALIDVRLQDINGLDLLNQIQEIAPNMIKIILTGYPQDEDRTTALERGADDYLSKPIKSEKLIEIIESRLEQSNCQPQTNH